MTATLLHDSRFQFLFQFLDDVAFVLGGVLPFCLMVAALGYFLPPLIVEIEWAKLLAMTGSIVACLFVLSFRQTMWPAPCSCANDCQRRFSAGPVSATCNFRCRKALQTGSVHVSSQRMHNSFKCAR